MKRPTLVACAVLALAGGCGKKKKTEPTPTPGVPVATGSGSSPPTPVAEVGNPGDLEWDEPLPESPHVTFRHDFFAGPPAPPIGNPDGVIERYGKECPPPAATPACTELRGQVEEILLDVILQLRSAGVPVDRRWYRFAAQAKLPQLACIAVRELGWAEGRKPEEDAVLVAAAEHPAPSVRDIVFRLGLPQLEQLATRSRTPRMSGACLEEDRDVDPGAKWAGGYPSARFRSFASDDDRRWFTTTDPVDQVAAYFAKSGKPAQTAQEMVAATQQKFVEEATRLSSDPNADPDKVAKQMTELMAKQGMGQTDWGEKARRVVDNADQVRFVMIAPNRAIAIFKDDVLKATSIVAFRPDPAREVPMPGADMTAVTKAVEYEQRVRQVYGF